MKLNKTKLNGLKFWYLSGDKFVGERIALGKYEEYETSLLLKQIKKDDVVVDVGANIGYYTLLMAQKAKKVYAIEPEEKSFEILKKNVKENNLKNVILIKAAASNKKGYVEIIRDQNNMGNHRTNPSKSPFDKGDLVDSVRLDDLIKEKIDLIKIDTQGWETEVVEGAKKIIKRDRPTIFVEYNPSQYKDERMVNFLRKRYSVIWRIDHWFYIYRKCGNMIKLNQETNYANLWMKKKINWLDAVNGYKNIQIKKLIKKIMGL